MISINNLHKSFNIGKSNQINAINGITLDIIKEEFLIIVGSNGSGKSTLLDLIAGSVLPEKGKIKIDSLDVTNYPDYKRSEWIARVFQNPYSGTASQLSILDNFRLASIRTQPKQLSIGISELFKNKVKEKISMLGMGIENKIEQPIGSLSGGQRQALTLLMSIMDDCKVLLLDEPTAALDPRSSGLIMQTADLLIKNFKLTAILITHNLKDAFNYGNRIILMNEGQIMKDFDINQKKVLNKNDLYDWFA
jgi:putative ABC transport system ATP-binding protein